MSTLTQLQLATARRALRLGWVRSLDNQRRVQVAASVGLQYGTGAAAATTRAKPRRVSNT